MYNIMNIFILLTLVWILKVNGDIPPIGQLVDNANKQNWQKFLRAQQQHTNLLNLDYESGRTDGNRRQVHLRELIPNIRSPNRGSSLFNLPGLPTLPPAGITKIDPKHQMRYDRGRIHLPITAREARWLRMHEKCKGVTITQTLKQPGCRPFVVKNMMCMGVCSATFVPRLTRTGDPDYFSSCHSCSPSEKVSVTVPMECQSGIKDFTYTVIRQCGCMMCGYKGLK